MEEEGMIQSMKTVFNGIILSLVLATGARDAEVCDQRAHGNLAGYHVIGDET